VAWHQEIIYSSGTNHDSEIDDDKFFPEFLSSQSVPQFKKQAFPVLP
jgi:hypothetical protein